MKTFLWTLVIAAAVGGLITALCWKEDYSAEVQAVYRNDIPLGGRGAAVMVRLEDGRHYLLRGRYHHPGDAPLLDLIDAKEAKPGTRLWFRATVASMWANDEPVWTRIGLEKAP